jgi:hypothetical protein
VSITYSNFTANSSSAEGGAMFLDVGTISTAFSTFSNNSSVGNAGGVAIYGGGTADFVFCTLSGNSSGFNGGALYNNGGTAKFLSSTLSGNSARFGGAITNASILKVDSSTVSNNSATDYGGGIVTGFLPATLNNTIVANSTGGDLADAIAFGGVPFDGSGNLVEDGSGGAGLGKITGDPNLGSLSDNGGPTLTHAPLSGSIAINAGNDALAGDAFFDQRGFSRFVGTIDIGSVEVQPITLIGSTHTAVPGLPVTFTANAPEGWTGTITFHDGTTVIGTAPIVGGVAKLTVQFETYGSHVVSASHPGAITATVTVSVVRAAMLADPFNPGENALFVGGTPASDLIGVDRHGHDRYLVGILSFPSGQWPSVWGGTFNGPVSRVVIYGGDGNDGIGVDNNLKADAWLYGGAGNDVMIGGGGNDLLIGGTGKDVLTARGGRDILLGGSDADSLFGGTGGDLLIAGVTDFDDNELALENIQLEWTSSRDADTRVKNLRGTGNGPRENGSTFLKVSGPDATVFSDNSKDNLKGGSGRDWLFANLTGSGVHDDIHGLKSSDIVDEL